MSGLFVSWVVACHDTSLRLPLPLHFPLFYLLASTPMLRVGCMHRSLDVNTAQKKVANAPPCGPGPVEPRNTQRKLEMKVE